MRQQFAEQCGSHASLGGIKPIVNAELIVFSNDRSDKRQNSSEHDDAGKQVAPQESQEAELHVAESIEVRMQPGY